MEGWLTVRDVAEDTGISDATLRRYLRYHGRYIKTRKVGSVLEISEESIPLLLKIRYYYEQGWNRQRVEQVLESTEPMALVVRDDEAGVDSTLGESLASIYHYLQRIENRQKELEEEVLRLRRELRERDQALLQGIQQANQSLSRVERHQQEKKGGFLSRLLGRK